MIYFIRANPSGSVKIGYTGKDPVFRIKTLQTGSSEPLTLLGSIDGGVDVERALHARFASYRLRPDCEWFRGDRALMAAIHDLLSRTVAFTASDNHDWRVTRLSTVLRISESRAFCSFSTRISELSDHEGMLEVRWYSVPRDEEKQAFFDAWEDLNELGMNVSHCLVPN